jgi:hypothetical protein
MNMEQTRILLFVSKNCFDKINQFLICHILVKFSVILSSHCICKAYFDSTFEHLSIRKAQYLKLSFKIYYSKSIIFS